MPSLKTRQLTRTTGWVLGGIAAAFLAFAASQAAATRSNSSSAQPARRIASPAAPACSAPEYRQFDFWIGDWDAFEAGEKAAEARVRVTRILGGCVLLEDYEQPGGAKGESFSIYDASRKVWHQTWVTNRGKLLVIEGKFDAGTMVLSGVDHARGDTLVRGVWKPMAGGVRETAVLSTDGGKSWKPWFDLYFHPHKRRDGK